MDRKILIREKRFVSERLPAGFLLDEMMKAHLRCIAAQCAKRN